MNDRVAELYGTIGKANTELKNIRKACEHEKSHVAMYIRIAAFHPQRMCSECDKPLGNPSEEEAKECWDDFNNGR